MAGDVRDHELWTSAGAERRSSSARAGADHEVPAGRDAEADGIRRFLDRVADPLAPRALSLVGDAGIGKTCLWWWLVGEAQRRGFTVLACRPPGRGPAYQGIRDLLAAVPTGRARPPATQSAAGEEHLDALRDILVASPPVLLAVDDWPYLDVESRRLIETVPRRLTGLPVMLATTVARRLGAATGRDAGIAHVGPPDASELLVVGPLPDAVMEHVLS